MEEACTKVHAPLEYNVFLLVDTLSTSRKTLHTGYVMFIQGYVMQAYRVLLVDTLYACEHAYEDVKKFKVEFAFIGVENDRFSRITFSSADVTTATAIAPNG